MSVLEAPEGDVIEISVLGRGLGESVVLHMGDGAWVILDSFRTKNGVSAPLAYLDQLRVPARSIALIVATHWHDDHVSGIGSLYRAACEADFVFSTALQRDEFAAFVGRQLEATDRPFSSGVKELLQVLEVFEQDARRPLIFANASQTLYLRHANETSFGKRVELAALSPSSWDIANFYRDLESGETLHATRLPLPARNHSSIACWAHFEDFSGILGADLEQTSDDGGWNAVLASRTLLAGKADYFKIPHHGSETAHSDDVWSQLLGSGAAAVLAPWMRGGKRLPKDSDITRIKTRAGALFIAKGRVPVSFKPSHPGLGKLITSGGALITAFTADFGIVQFRRKIGASSWSTSLGGGAEEL